jgi:hypothetical protein
MILNLR